MEKNNLIVKADIRRITTWKRRLILILFLILLALSILVGLMFASHSFDYFFINHFSSPLDAIYILWFDLPLYHCIIIPDTNVIYSEDFYILNIVLLSLGYILVASSPFIIKALYSRMTRNTELYVTDKQVIGSYSSFIFKKTLQIPIEKVDNLTICSTFLDKLRTGKTLGICSASGIIKLHFVHNAEQVVALTMERISEIKNKEKESKEISQATTVSVISVSITDKIKELVSLKDAGLITEEEFVKKRENILAKM